MAWTQSANTHNADRHRETDPRDVLAASHTPAVDKLLFLLFPSHATNLTSR